MNKFFLILFLFCVSCGKPSTEFEGIDSEFDPYLTKLNEMSLEHTGKELNYDVPINFKKLPPNRRGECSRHSNPGGSSSEIFIDPDKWDNLSDDPEELSNGSKISVNNHTRLAILLHEIGHCVYGRGHDDSRLEGYIDGSFPNSIMVSNTVNGYIFERLQEHFFNELVGE